MKWFSGMRRAALAVVIGAAVLVPSAVSAQAMTSQWSAAMTGSQEVPANSSTATGTFTATLDEAAGTLTWTLSVPSITNATAAHLHTGGAGVNGPVVLGLFQAPSGSPASSVNTSGTARQSDLSGPLQGNFAEFVRAVKAGTIYVNVHTSAIPAGEIRAQVTAAGAQATPTTTATATTPVAPKTGNAGMLGASTGAATAATLAVLAASVVLGGRALASRRG